MNWKLSILCLLLCFKGFSQSIDEQLEELKDKNDLKVGVVLSGGGAKGFAHIAILEALEKTGVRIDYIGGTSMGAIVGGLYSAGYSTQQLDSIFNAIDFEKLIQNEIPRSVKSFYAKEHADRYLLSLPFNDWKIGMPSSFSRGTNLYNLLSELTFPVNKIDDFSQLPIPFLCMAVDLETGEELLLERGNLAESILASGSLPALFSPISVDGRYLIDGGVLNNYPVDEIRNKGVDIVIGVDIQSQLKSKKDLHSVMDILLQISGYKTSKEIPLKKSKTDIYIKPNVTAYNVVSFDKGRAIIDSGKVEVKKYLEDFKKIASRQQPLQQKRAKIQSKDFIKLNSIDFTGNHHYSNAYMRGKLGVNTTDSLSFKDFKDGVLNLASTENFKSIRYHICSSDLGEDIFFNVEENPNRTELKASFHYDKLYKANFLFNFTKRGFLQKNNVISLDFIASIWPRYRFDYYVDNGFYTSYGFTSEFNQFEKNLNPSIFNPSIPINFDYATIKMRDLTNQIYLQTIFFQKFLSGLGLEHRFISVDAKNFARNNRLVHQNLISSYAYLKFDTLDDTIVPTSGVQFSGNVNWYLLSFEEVLKWNVYGIINTKMSGAFSVSDRLSFFSTARLGFNIGGATNPAVSFLIGGYGNNLLPNMIPFLGYDYLKIASDQYLMAQIEANYRIYKKNYLYFSANFAHIEDDLFQRTEWIETFPKYSGYSLGVTSKTILGPVQVKISYSPELKDTVWFFNAGFWF